MQPARALRSPIYASMPAFYQTFPSDQHVDYAPFLENASLLRGGTPYSPTMPTLASPEHDPSAPPDAKSISADDWATVAHSAPGMSDSRSSVSSSFSRSYLHSALVSQNGTPDRDVWIADDGAPCHMTHDSASMDDVRFPSAGDEKNTIGYGSTSNVDMTFHGDTDKQHALFNV